MSTRTFAILDVAPATFKDLVARLAAAGVLDDYTYFHTSGRLIVFGTTAIRSEDDPARGAEARKTTPRVRAHAACNDAADALASCGFRLHSDSVRYVAGAVLAEFDDNDKAAGK